jgi:dihydrofolate synthase/folylpolyglutamate synthase
MSHRLAGAYLAQRTLFGMKLGLETMRALLEELGRPELRYPSLLVAGTNGKGSVAASVDAALRGSGLRTGRYTSPHLVRVNERITVDGRAISDEALERAVLAVREAASRLVKRGAVPAHPTFFEALTAAALVHFARRRVDAAVLEVGLGGRLDATNVADPIASAIVSIDLDHQAYLGTTLGSIAAEKAGVLRRGRTTVVGPLPAEAGRAVRERARAVGARLAWAAREVRITPRADGRLDLRTPRRAYRGLVPLPGRHQRDNLAVAVRLVEEAQAAGLRVDLHALPAAIARVRWPGRLERVPGDPPLLLDGAHNPAGARALAAHLRGTPHVLLFGAMADKDVEAMAATLFGAARAVVLSAPRVSRAASPATIARRAGAAGRGAHRERSVFRALRLARKLARADGPGTTVVVAGSLYLVGAVKALLERE